MTQAELAQDAGFSADVVVKGEANSRKFQMRTAIAILEALARRSPVLESEAHDFLVAAGTMEPAGGFIGHAMHAEFSRKKLLRDKDTPPPPPIVAGAASALPPHVERLALQLLDVVGESRFVTVLQTMLALAHAEQAEAPSFNVRHPPIQRPGYTEEIVRTYEHVSPPGGASRASKPASGE